jgi:urease accessory protein
LSFRVIALPAQLDAASLGVVPRWDARLALEFAPLAGESRLVRRSHSGPLQVQRPFHPEVGGAAHVYLLHPPGGLVGGDRLEIDVVARSGACVLLTSPAATKFYRSREGEAAQRVAIRVESGATVEWLPQETLVFGGATARSEVAIDVATGGRFIAWDISCLGRPASGDDFSTGSYAQRLDVRVDGVPVAIERGEFGAESLVRRGRFGLRGRSVFGTLVALSTDAALADAVRAVLPASTESDLFGVTARRHVLVCRYLGDSVARAKEGFVRAWSTLRVALLNRAPVLPRVWAT